MDHLPNLLAIDTSTDRPALALLTRDGRRHAATVEGSRRHGRDLVPYLRDLMARACLPLAEVNVIAVGLGPGSYTGLRIGLTAARTLAYAAGAGLLGFDSLEAWARTASPSAMSVRVVADAQRGDVYSADFARAARGESLTRVSATRIEPLAAWSARLDGPATVVGPGLESPVIRAAVPGTLTMGFESDPSGPSRALAILELARERWASGQRDDLWALEPNYLRRSAAEDQWDVRAAAPLVRNRSGGS